MNDSAPLELHTEVVHPDWIDYNGHMNVAYYVLAFDHASDALFEYLGMGESYRSNTGDSNFAIEGHITYDRELKLGDPMRFTSQLLDYDRKRVHYVNCMYHASEGYLASTNELITVHVNLESRRSSPMPNDVQARLEHVVQLHRTLPVPPHVGRVIGIRRR
jgi:acyl-CoA thioester hydrolase